MSDAVTHILEVKGVSGGYGKVPILHGLEFAVAENEVVGILGHNGMGKTTLLKTLMGFLPASSGTIRFHSTDITGLSPNERAGLGLGYVPQGRGIFQYAGSNYSQGRSAERPPERRNATGPSQCTAPPQSATSPVQGDIRQCRC